MTGIFRATSVRTNPRHRTLRSIYKTFVDIVHIRKLDKNSRRAAAMLMGSKPAQAPSLSSATRATYVVRSS